MPSLGDLRYKKYFMEFKSVWDFPTIDDSFFIQAFNKLFIGHL